MDPQDLFWLVARGIDINGGDDPRVSSARNDSSGGGTVSAVSGNKSSSAGKLGTSFIPSVAIFGACLLIFIVMRPRLRRVFAPRTIAALRYPEAPTPELPSGLFNWILPFFRVPDSHILDHGSIDGFFFIRFLKVIRNICIAGCIITWPILFPINLTGGNDAGGLANLTLGNVKDPNKLYAHLFLGWLFFGFVLYLIVRECIYYANLRQAYLSSPHYSTRLSSRTLLVTNVPERYLDERRLKKLYGEAARRVYIPCSDKALAKIVEEREQTAKRLEDAEVALIRKANAARNKFLKAHPNHPLNEGPNPPSSPTPGFTSLDIESAESVTHEDIQPRPLEVDLPGPDLLSQESKENLQLQDADKEKEAAKVSEDDLDYIHPFGLSTSLPNVRGSVAAQWIPAESRPHHRPIGNFLRRVDTIRWTRMRLKDLNLHIYKMRRRVRRGETKPLPAAFIEFDTQEAAQSAHQTLTHHRPLQMSTRLLGIRPDEVIWSSLRMSWWETIMRKTAVFALILAAIVFWSLPTAFIGFISNISSVTKLIPFLKVINVLPKVILDFIQSFLPPVLLTLWMSTVPYMLRFCGRQSGIPSTIMVELFTQSNYFSFQVVQVFLITTLTSAASGAIQDIIKQPFQAQNLLAKNLPAASDFYLSYILIQCVFSGATGMLQVFGFLRHVVLVKFTNNPRSRFKQWRQMRVPQWGALFPVYANMGVIALSYACIAPLVLGFAALGVEFIRIIWRYNLIYVCDSTHDSKGLFYPRALLHLIIGLYIAEICLVGLFALKGIFAPVALMVIFLLFTLLVHISLSEAIAPLLTNLPQTLAMEAELQEEDRLKAEREAEAEQEAANSEPAGAAADYYNPDERFGDEEDPDEEAAEFDSDMEDDVTVTNDRALEGASSIRAVLMQWLKLSTKEKVEAEVERSGANEALHKLQTWLGVKSGKGPPGFVAKWLHPEEYEDFVALRKTISEDGRPNIDYSQYQKYCDYTPPELWKPKPVLWIPRDDARVSRQEVSHTRAFTPISDRGCILDEKGRVIVDFTAAPCDEPRLII